MSRFFNRRPSPAMVVAIVACVLAVAGTASGAGFLSLKSFSHGAQVNTVGVGPLIYTSTQTLIPANQSRAVSIATCPTNTKVIGGGIRVSTGTQVIEGVTDSYPVNNGWAGTVSNSSPSESHTALNIAICAKTLKSKGTFGGF